MLSKSFLTVVVQFILVVQTSLLLTSRTPVDPAVTRSLHSGRFSMEGKQSGAYSAEQILLSLAAVFVTVARAENPQVE